ncbi:putative nucleic acid-binding protein [Candidatus Promineifilum breve]|uniref:Ribonuclease VapC n=1 Tax=Candidatus Promineifilum breve TaxID=1806508 RepID=A0A160T1K2_9CHLR|nr:putative nucleic acid-binding protein [Candidatus Promineifilum breve]
MVNATFLLDTNAISEPLRPSPNQQFLNRIQENEGRIAIAAVVWHELLYGCWRLPASKRRNAIERYLFDVVRTTMPILPYDAAAAQWHAAERARLTQIGRSPAFADGQIAAIAAVQGLTLVTANTADFANFEGVETVNWLAT